MSKRFLISISSAPLLTSRTAVRGTAACLAICLVLTACDTGDGKTLREPTGTLPPPTVPDTLPSDGTETLPSLPIQDLGSIDTIPLPTNESDLPNEFRVIAPWIDGALIDARHSCDGLDVAPALSWVGVPPDAVELAVAVVDESIDNGPPFVHWVIAGINPASRSLIENDVPLGAIQGINFFGDVGWGGPCPPQGVDAHVYRFTVYALNQQVELADGTPAEDLLDFIRAVSLTSADVTGTYLR